MMSREKCRGGLRCGVEGTDIVGPDQAIGGHEREVFAMRLGDKHAVERIRVVRGGGWQGERGGLEGGGLILGKWEQKDPLEQRAPGCTHQGAWTTSTGQAPI